MTGVDLDPHLEAFVRRQIDAGRYHDVGEVIRDRLRLLSLGLGGVEDHPIVVDTGQFIGRPADGAAAQSIALYIKESVDPMEDHTASADYRGALAQVLAERVFLQAAEEARRRRDGGR